MVGNIATKASNATIAAGAVLNASPSKLLKEPNLLGLLFESLVVRDLRVYTQGLGGRLLQYRDSDDLEVDIIFETDDGKWAGVEVKRGAPAFMGVITTLLFWW